MTYTCPMHPKVIQDTMGRCPDCKMKLVPQSDGEKPSHHMEEKSSYKPLFIVIGLITLATLVLGLRDSYQQSFSLQNLMAYFMAGFFLVFSGFKLMDLSGFAQGYATYDLLAKKWYGYGYVYPFLELILGLFYLTGFELYTTNLLTFILMTFSGIGVFIAMQKKQKIQCACLGTFLKVPLTKVTLIEDFGMALMAGLSLVL